jgi:hypothetical protein
MPDQVPSFEHQALEADLKVLAVEVQKNREHPEMRNSSEHEILKNAILAFPKLPPVSQAAGGMGQTPSPGPLPAYTQDSSPEVRLEIEYLLDMALHQGLGKALAQSEKSPYFVQDAFHDALAGKLYPELQKRGIVK